MTQHKYKLYILAYDAVFTWHHFITKPLKWIIKGFTGSDYSHISYVYNYAGQGKNIKEVTSSGFHSIGWLKSFRTRPSKIYAYEVKVPIDFERLHDFTNQHIGDKYEVDEAINSVIDRVPVLSHVFRFFFRIKKKDKDFSFCDKIGLLILKDQGYLKYIKDDNSLNPEELIKEMQKAHLCYTRRLIWNKTHIVNNIFV